MKGDIMPNEEPNTRFTEEAAQRRPSLAGEVWTLLRTQKKYWMLPIFIVFLVFGLLMLLGGTAAAPFIYTLF